MVGVPRDVRNETLIVTSGYRAVLPPAATPANILGLRSILTSDAIL